MNIHYPWFDEADLFVWMQQGLWGNIKFYVAYAWFFTWHKGYPIIVLGMVLLCIWLLSGCALLAARRLTSEQGKLAIELIKAQKGSGCVCSATHVVSPGLVEESLEVVGEIGSATLKTCQEVCLELRR